MLLSAILCCAALLLGFLLGRGAGATPSVEEIGGLDVGAPAAPGDGPSSSGRQPPDKPSSERQLEPTSLVELLQISGRVAALRAALDELDPLESLWPEDAPLKLQPEVFTSEVEAVLEELGVGALQLMDCAEYPCVATLVIPPAQEPEVQIDGLRDLMELRGVLAERLELPVDAHMDTHPGGTWLTLGAHPEGVGDARLRQRLEEAWTAAAH